MRFFITIFESANRRQSWQALRWKTFELYLPQRRAGFAQLSLEVRKSCAKLESEIVKLLRFDAGTDFA
jgi:hypothetical protein